MAHECVVPHLSVSVGMSVAHSNPLDIMAEDKQILSYPIMWVAALAPALLSWSWTARPEPAP